MRIDLISPYSASICFSAPHPASSCPSQTLQNVMSGLGSSSRFSACLLSAGETSAKDRRCSVKSSAMCLVEGFGARRPRLPRKTQPYVVVCPSSHPSRLAKGCPFWARCQAKARCHQYPGTSSFKPTDGSKVLAEPLHWLISIVRRESHQTLAIISSTRAESFAWHLRKRGGMPYNKILHAAAEQCLSVEKEDVARPMPMAFER